MSVPMQVGLLKSDHGLRRQAIVESLLKDIVQGRLRPGQHLVTQELAERFGVSHTPIREALIALAGIGVVDLLPNRGAVVRRVTAVEVREICQVRRVLECEAARSACGRIDLAELLAVREALRGLIGRESPDRHGSIAEARAVDSRLHDLIAASCGNAFLAQEIGRLKILFRAFRDVAWEHDEARNDYRRLAEEAREHLAIVEALLAGDRRRAVRAMARHIRSGVKYWSRALPEAIRLAGGYAQPPLRSRRGAAMIQPSVRTRDRHCRRPRLAGRLALVLVAACAGVASAADAKLEYNRDIRPILAENCFACHGPDSAARKADLRLDRRDDGRRGRGHRPRQAGRERARSRASSRTTTSEVMPPPKSHKKLTAGAEGDCSSAGSPRGPSTSRTGRSSPPTRPALPAVKNAAWVRNPIDRFVLAELEAAGLDARPGGRPPDARPPAEPRPDRPAARRRPTSRRSSTTRRPDAYEKLRRPAAGLAALGRAPRPLLARRRPLRRHARHPLRQLPRDVVLPRLGHQRLQPRTMPFDQFTIEQLAGDLLPEPRRSTSRSPPASTAATSRPTRAARSPRSTSSSTPATAPRPSSQVWLGLTAGCAVCHDHKFDPLTPAASSTRCRRSSTTRRRRRWTATSRTRRRSSSCPQPEDRPRWDALSKRAGRRRARPIDARKQAARADFDKWLAAAKADDARRDDPGRRPAPPRRR